MDLKIPEHLPLPLDKFERPKRRGSPVVVVVLSGYLNPSESASPDAAKPRGGLPNKFSSTSDFVLILKLIRELRSWKN